MKKRILLCLGAFLIIVTCLTACADSPTIETAETTYEESTMVYYEEFIADDTVSLEDALTAEYDIDELRDFFADTNMNEDILKEDEMRWMSFTEVNERFPVEIIRTRNYSVYKVRQGGYFYVFWSKTYNEGVSTELIEPDVYFTAYLSSSRDKKIFKGLKPRISTAEDVRALDPSFQLNFWKSNGSYSYSYLNEDEVLEIRYMDQSEMMGYDDLVVESMKIVERQEASTNFRAILSKDLPRE